MTDSNVYDFMVGDWVKERFLDKEEYFQINEISASDNWVQLQGRSFHTYAIDILPIPLTKEMLSSNGFNDKCYATLQTEDCTIEICLDDNFLEVPMYIRKKTKTNSNMDWNYCFPHPHYVHQLQHILRICGLMELANNFKLK